MTDETKLQPGESVDRINDDEMDLVDLFIILWKWKLLLLLIPVVATAVTAFRSLKMVPIYETKTTLFVVSETGRGQVLSLVQDGLPAGLLGGLFGPTHSDYLMALLSSNTAANRVIKRLKLAKKGAFAKGVEKPVTALKLIERFKRVVEVKRDTKTGGVTVSAEGPDPKLIAEIANVLVKEAELMVVTRGDAHLAFLEKRVKQARKRMGTSQKTLTDFQKRSNGVELSTRIQEQIRLIAALRQREMDISVRLADIQERVRTAGNIELLAQFQVEKEGLEKSHSEVQRQLAVEEEKLNVVPDQSMELANLTLENKITVNMYESLLKELEIAKLERDKDQLVFQVVDPAVVPESHVKPRKRLLVMAAFASSALFAFFLVFVLEFLINFAKRLRKRLAT